jgi:hypothetical protein
MKVKKKAKWIRKAMKEFREYEDRVLEFKAGFLFRLVNGHGLQSDQF